MPTLRSHRVLLKCAPPIRSREDREALWEPLGDGTLGMVVSDHSPAPLKLKARDTGNFLTAWGGMASLELRLVATWEGARIRGYGLEDVAGWLASAPTSLAGLDARKGRIAEGKDADFVVFDPDGVSEVDPRRLRQRHALSPYDGRRLAHPLPGQGRRGIEDRGIVFQPVSEPSGDIRFTVTR